MLRLLCAIKALLFPFALAVLLLGLQFPAQAQSAPFPDMNEDVRRCMAFHDGMNCQLQAMQYIDKPPSSNTCPGQYCAGGPGRYQEVRMINPPGSQFEYYIWSFAFVPDDVIVKLSGPSFTRALPAGPALVQTISTRQGNYPFPRAAVGFQFDGGSFHWGLVTDQAGEVKFNFVPPSRQTATFHIKVACWSGCSNTDEKDIVVAACDLCQGKGNPIAPGSGEKLQTESLWQDAGAHPLSVSLHYRSFGAAPAGMGTYWSHDYAATTSGTQLSRLVQLGNGTRFTFNRRDTQSPWLSDTGADALADTPSGLAFTRAGDETRWQFDAAGVLQSITQRNGWAMTLTYSAGKLTRVTNAFGRSLALAYDASGRLATITPPGGGAITAGYDASTRLAFVSFPDGTSRGYVYENPGYPNALTGIVNESAYRYASFGYDGSGRAILTQHDGGAGAYTASYPINRGIQITTDPIGPETYRDRVRVTTPLGATQYYDYQGGDGSVRLVGSSAKESWDDIANRITGPGNLPTSETDFMGNVTTFNWDANRKLLLSTTAAANKPEAKTTQTQWHPTLRLPALVTEGGRSTAYTYDQNGNKLSEAITDTALNQTRTTRWTYGANGLMATMTDARGGVWQYAYDSAGNQTSATNPLGQQTRYAYDGAGRLTSQTAANGLVTTFTWDARGRLLSQANAAEITTYSYTTTGQLASVRLPSGQIVTYSYDTAQRLIGANDNRGNKITYTLDAAGNRTREEVRDASGAIAKLTTRVIDNLNRLTHVQGAMGQTTQLGYDANGQAVAETDPLSQMTRQSLDGLGRSTATTFADSNAASQAWNQLDQLTTVTDPKGVKTSYETNAFGDVTVETSPDIGTVRFQHDLLGNITQKTDAKGIVTSWTRDALGRPTEVRHGPDQLVIHSYDAAGQVGYLSGVEDKSGTTRYERDALGRVTKKTQTVNDNPGNPSSFATSYSYAAGELASITYASGFKVIYKRDATGQITGIDTQAPGKNKPVNAFVSNLTLTALGQPKAWSWSNGDVAARSFDADGRMTQSEFASYSYDAASRITGITQNLFAQSASTGTVYLTPLAFTAGYDNRNRLTSFARDGAETRYTYDANSNRLSALDKVTSDTDLDGEFDDADFAKATSQSLAVDAASNKLLGFTQTVVKTNLGTTRSTVVTPVNYSLDANGALTSDGLRSFEYDDASRLAKVSLSKDGEAAAVSYLHNAMGQRVFKSEVQIAQTLPDEETLGVDFVTWLKAKFKWMFVRDQGNTSVGTAYAYGDGALPEWAILGEYDNGSATGAGRTEYIWLPTADGAIPIGMFRNGNLFAIHVDHLGTPRLLTNENKVPVWQWPYSAFGNNKPTGVLKATAKPKQAMTNQPVLLKATAATELNLRMPGQYFDVETGAFYNYFRTYDSRTGQYWQPDPIGLGGGANRFSYVGGSPLKHIDPFGLVKHTTGSTIECGKGCTIRIDYTFDEKTGKKARHLHWECKGSQGACGEDGAESHGQTWDDVPEKIKECARRAGFNGVGTASTPKVPGSSWKYIAGGLVVIGGILLLPELAIPAAALGAMQ